MHTHAEHSSSSDANHPVNITWENGRLLTGKDSEQAINTACVILELTFMVCPTISVLGCYGIVYTVIFISSFDSIRANSHQFLFLRTNFYPY